MDASLANDFLIESKEHLQTVEEDLLQLERQADAPQRPLVDKLFRAMHSIKGGAGFLGLKNINALAHRMETLLAMVRSGDLKPAHQVIEVLLQGSDRIAALLDDLAGSDAQGVSKEMRLLDMLLQAEAAPEAQRQLATPAPIQEKASGKPFPFPVNQFQLRSRAPENRYLFVLRFDLALMAKGGGMSPVALVRELSRAGEVVDGHLALGGDDLRAALPSGLSYDVLFATPIPQEVLGQMLLEHIGLPDLAVVPVEESALVPTSTPAVAEAVASAPGLVRPVPASAPSVEPPTGMQVKAAPADASAGTVRISLELLDQLMTQAGELVLVRNQQLMVADRADPAMKSAVQRLNLVASELQETIMRTRMQPMGNVFSRFPRVVRDLGAKLGKQIELAVQGNEVEVDKTILESLADPLKHLVRNSCDHGIERSDERLAAGKPGHGTISLRAYHEGGQIIIEVADDGRGIDVARVKEKALQNRLKTAAELERMPDKEAWGLIFLPGFSTAEVVTDVSGRGVGMDVVKTAVERLGGQFDVSSEPGRGTTILLRLPLTLAIIPCLVVVDQGHRYAIPQVNLEELVCLYDADVGRRIEVARDQEVFRLRDHLLPLVRLGEVLAHPVTFDHQVRAEIVERHAATRSQIAAKGGAVSFAVVKVGLKRFGIVVDQVVGTEEIVVKPMHPALKHLAIYSGATVMGDGQVALILDIEGIARHAGLGHDGSQQAQEKVQVQADAHHLLLFRAGEQERFAVALPLIRRIQPIETSAIERVGTREFITVDHVPTAIVRLDRLLEVSPLPEVAKAYLLLPKHTAKPVGILVSQVIDIELGGDELDTRSHRQDGMLGSAVVRDHLTIFLDLYRVIEMADPGQRPATPTGERPRALLAEDTSFFRQLLSGYLESAGFEVEAYGNGALALEAFNARAFDLIVSDLEMPVMDGWELLRQVRRGGRNAQIPALALTSLKGESAMVRAKEAGFDRFEVKMDRTRFLDTVSQLLDRVRN